MEKISNKIINSNNNTNLLNHSNSIDYIKSNNHYITKKKTFNFYTLKNGSLISCHGKPKKNDLIFMKETYNMNYVLTILHSGENPEIIKKFCNEIGNIEWENLPLKGANMALFMNKEVQSLILNHILKLIKEMNKKKLVIFIHCAAGVHRTGTILYTILRCTGESKESAMEAIKKIRIETWRNCGENRINYAEEYLVKPLLKIIEELKNNNDI